MQRTPHEATLSQIQAGKVRALAVLGVPTANEGGGVKTALINLRQFGPSFSA
jgi:hypothetical protein